MNEQEIKRFIQRRVAATDFLVRMSATIEKAEGKEAQDVYGRFLDLGGDFLSELKPYDKEMMELYPYLKESKYKEKLDGLIEQKHREQN